MAQELTGVGAMTAAGVVGMMAAANAGGRLTWAWLSDLVGRRLVFTALLLLAAALRLLPLSVDVAAFTALASVAMLCFGGGLVYEWSRVCVSEAGTAYHVSHADVVRLVADSS
jgi:MFS transporter, OFA family, oxalate/formate antiporter